MPWEPLGYYYEPASRPGLHPYHEAGVYYLQEASAMSAVALLDPRPGERICDLCAAPGGKSTQIAGRMLGQGLLLYLAVQKKREGLSAEELVQWVEENKLHIDHWFTVDDLNFLKMGGRVSATTAFLGTMLSIKPVMHVDDQGRLIPVSKARGRKASLTALVDKMAETAIDPEHQTVFISHGDCLEDARFVADEVRRRLGVKNIHINYVGPVIGNHSGPGTMALFFLGKER